MNAQADLSLRWRTWRKFERVLVKMKEFLYNIFISILLRFVSELQSPSELFHFERFYVITAM